MADAARQLPAADDVLTIAEAAALCRVSVDVLYRLAAEGAVPAAKVGAQWRLRRSVLLRWLDESAASFTFSPVAVSGGATSPAKAARRSASPSTAPRTPPRIAPRPSASGAANSTRALLLRAVKGI